MPSSRKLSDSRPLADTILNFAFGSGLAAACGAHASAIAIDAIPSQRERRII